MPAQSIRQARLMRLVRGVQKGDIPASKVGGDAKKLAKTMDPEDVKDFAKTPDKGLPLKKESILSDKTDGQIKRTFFAMKKKYPSLDGINYDTLNKVFLFAVTSKSDADKLKKDFDKQRGKQSFKFIDYNEHPNYNPPLFTLRFKVIEGSNEQVQAQSGQEDMENDPSLYINSPDKMVEDCGCGANEQAIHTSNKQYLKTAVEATQQQKDLADDLILAYKWAFGKVWEKAKKFSPTDPEHQKLIKKMHALGAEIDKLVKQYHSTPVKEDYNPEVKVGTIVQAYGFPLFSGLKGENFYKVVSIDGDKVTFRRCNELGDIGNMGLKTYTADLKGIKDAIESVEVGGGTSGLKIWSNGENVMEGRGYSIDESSLSRVYSHVVGNSKIKSWGMISAYRKAYSKKENEARNKQLQSQIRGANLGYFMVEGHWMECQLPGTPYEKCPKEKLEEVTEQTFFIPNVTKQMLVKWSNQFEQDGAIYGDKEEPGKTFFLKSNGSMSDIGSFSANKIGLLYSKMRGNRTFLFADKNSEIEMNEASNILVHSVNPDACEAFLKKYPKVRQTMLAIAKKNNDLMKGYKAFLKFKDKQEAYLGGRPEVTGSPTFGEKTFYKYDWMGTKGWAEIYQYIDGIKLESVNEVKVQYDFSPDELTRIIQTLKRHSGTMVKPIKALEKALGKEISAYESVTEARGAKLIQREYDKTVGEIEDTLESYKKAKGTPKAAGFVSKLKELNARKKSLETELDTKISGLYKDAELKQESFRIKNFIKK